MYFLRATSGITMRWQARNPFPSPAPARHSAGVVAGIFMSRAWGFSAWLLGAIGPLILKPLLSQTPVDKCPSVVCARRSRAAPRSAQGQEFAEMSRAAAAE